MAEERNLGLARAPENETADAEPTKEELQRRMDEARESISQTVTEIKETVVNQYQQVRESISDTLDWREQYRRHTVPFTVGAVGAGVLLGYSVGGAVFGEGNDYYEEDDADYDADDRAVADSAPRSYAAQAVVGAPAVASRASRPALSRPRAASEEDDYAPESRPSYAAAYDTQSAPAEPEGPSLFDRFKETKAYDRLQQELYGMGDRFVEELSKTARTVVLPALLSKVKDMIGIDLGTQKEVAQRSQLEQQAAKASAGTAHAETASAASAGAGTTPGTTTPSEPSL